VRLNILGPLDISSDTGTVSWQGAKRRGLLALLLCNRGNPLPVERIVDALWPEPHPGATKTVHTYLSQLRRLVAAEPDVALARRANGYELELGDDVLDAARFERLLTEAQNVTDDGRRVARLRDALSCWNGDALQEFLGEHWADRAARHLEEQRVQAHEACVRAELALGRGAELVPELEGLTARYPTHESLWAHLMVALYRAGRQADALRAGREVRTHLVEELGVEPGPEVTTIERRILEHDDTLRAVDALPDGAVRAWTRGTNVIRPPLTVELHPPPHSVGRAAELAQLEAMVASARSGHPRVAVVRGDIGIGKTRLVCDLVDLVAPVTTVHTVACQDSKTRSFRSLVELLEPGELRDRVEDGAGIDDDAEWHTLRNRVFAALRDALAPRDGTSATVLVVEDVHWADRATLEFLDDLGTELDRRDVARPLAVVVTRRAFGADEDVETVTRRLERLPGATVLRLQPLHEVGVQELVRAAGVSRPARGLVRLLHERSRGNPLYVTEALYRLADLDAFVEHHGRVDSAVDPDRIGAPADLHALIEHRIAQLDDDTLEVLGTAVLYGDVIDVASLRELAGPAVDAHLDTLAGRGLVERDGEGVRFVHHLVASVVRGRLAPDRVHALHRAIACTLRARRDRDGTDVTSQLAHHVLEGGLDGLPAVAIRDLWAAGRVAVRVADWAEAARLFEAAIQVGEQHAIGDDRLARMRYWSGRCLEHDYDVERALARYREAATWGREHGDVRLWATAALAAGTRMTVGTKDVFDADLDVSDFTTVLPHLGDEHAPLRCRVLRKYAEVQMQLMRFDDGAELARDALDLARRCDDASLVAQSASTLAYAHLAAGSATPALELLRELDRRALAGRPESEGFALARLGIAALMTADLDTADAAVAEAGAVFDAVRHRAGSSLAETLTANLALLHGDLDAAEQRAARAHELFVLSRYFLALPILFSVLTEVRLLRGDERGASEAVHLWRETGQEGADVLAVMVAARTGAPVGDAVHRFGGLLGFLCEPSVLAPSMAAVAAEAARAAGDTHLAGRVVDDLARMPDTHVVLGAGFPYIVDRTRAIALEARGDRDGARDALDRALDVADRAGVPIELARTHVALAHVLAEREPTLAARHAEAARAIADQHGLRAVAQAAREARTSLR
jgi:DNA-binding SARP family transcriptional activator/tetratricopeptide (TPR) repeat protein